MRIVFATILTLVVGLLSGVMVGAELKHTDALNPITNGAIAGQMEAVTEAFNKLVAHQEELWQQQRELERAQFEAQLEALKEQRTIEQETLMKQWAAELEVLKKQQAAELEALKKQQTTALASLESAKKVDLEYRRLKGYVTLGVGSAVVIALVGALCYCLFCWAEERRTRASQPSALPSQEPSKDGQGLAAPARPALESWLPGKNVSPGGNGHGRITTSDPCKEIARN